jgi:hypothetical protein
MTMYPKFLRIVLVLFGVLPLVLARFTFKHIRIVDGVESVRATGIQLQSAYLETAVPEDVSKTRTFALSKRWDGSQAYNEWQPTLNRGCTLDGMLQEDDAQAGKLLIPQRQLAHSDFLELNGAYIFRNPSA